MDSKSNQVLLGLILLLLGAVAFIMNIIKIDYGAITLVFSGLAFLLLYYTKKKSWSLVVGSYLAYFGITKIVSQMGFYYQIPISIGIMFFLMPGIIFMVLYFHKNKRGLLIPASILVWVGLYIILVGLPLFQSLRFALFFICFGLSFVTMYVSGRDFVKKGTLYIGILMLILGTFKGIGIPLGSFAQGHVAQLIAGAIVIAGVAIIIRAIVKK